VAAAIALFVLLLPTLLERVGLNWVKRTIPAESRISRALRLIAFDIAAFLVSTALALLLVHFLYKQEFLIGKFAVALVAAAVRWRLTMIAVKILLRPAHQELRLVPVDDERATLAARIAGGLLALGILFISVVPVLLQAGLEFRVAQAIALLIG